MVIKPLAAFGLAALYHNGHTGHNVFAEPLGWPWLALAGLCGLPGCGLAGWAGWPWLAFAGSQATSPLAAWLGCGLRAGWAGWAVPRLSPAC